MPNEEKSSWVMLFVAVAGYITYLVIVLSKAAGAPLPEADYAIPMLGTIGGAILVSMLLHMLLGIGSHKKDQRDREIYRFGEYTGYAFITIGALSAMLLSLIEVPHFWIANVIYLCFVLSGILSSIAKIVAYRAGMPRW